MKTKDKILLTALSLFNEGNTQAATTNHIAAAMGISPGNLHYHYKNREAIIFRLYEQMKSKTELPPEALPATLAEVHAHFIDLARIYWEYRFFHRELLFLLSRDPALKTQYVADTVAHRGRILTALRHLADNGYLQFPVDNALEHLADTTLLATQFWNGLLETTGRPLDPENVSGVFDFLRESMRPYLTKKGLKELAEIGA